MFDELVNRKIAAYRQSETRNTERKKEWLAKFRKEQPDRDRAYARKGYYKTKYNMTAEQRDAMVLEQGGCASCGCETPKSKKGWHIDHCHSTGKVRGVVCQPCNLALGHVKDDVAHLEKLIGYLQRYK